MFVKVTAKATEIDRESTVQLSRADILEEVFGVNGSIKLGAGLFGGVINGEVETGLEFQETRTDSTGSSTGEVWKYSIEVLTRNLQIELQDL